MRKGWLLAGAILILAGCSPERTGLPGPGVDPEPFGGTLLLESATGVTSLDAGTGRVLFEGSGVPALGNPSTLFTATPSAGDTVLEARDAVTGEVTSRARLPGDLSVRVVSGDGLRAALMRPPPGGDPWRPVPRTVTTIVVSSLEDQRDPVRYRLRGNFEPEAFSEDGRRLFLVRFVPPRDPVAYRVAVLDLSTGEVAPVLTGEKPVVETMSGTRLEQVASPDGAMLYTLYTTDSAGGGDPHGGASFVHTLSLAEGWAHCVALPRELWGGDPAHQAMAVSPDGGLLYLVDAERDLVTAMDTDDLAFTTTASVDLGAPGATAHAAVGSDGTLFVAGSRRVVALDPATLAPVREWDLEAPVTGLGSGPGGLHVAMAGAVTMIDPGTGLVEGSVPTPAAGDLVSVAALDR